MLTVIVILWLLVWALVVFDMFRRDWSTSTKVLWALGMLVFPVVGVLAYLIVRPPAAADTEVHMGVTTHGELEEQTQNRQPR
jgi:Phospholipase_D-nuclease N-terminal